MKPGATLKIIVSLSSCLLLLAPGCKSQWPFNTSSNPYSGSSINGASLDPYAQPYLPAPGPIGGGGGSGTIGAPQPAFSPAGIQQQYVPPAQPFQPQTNQPFRPLTNQPFQPQVNQPFQPQVTQPFQPQVSQPSGSGSGSGTVNQFPSGAGSGSVNQLPLNRSAPVNPYGSISPTGGGFSTNTTIP